MIRLLTLMINIFYTLDFKSGASDIYISWAGMTFFCICNQSAYKFYISAFEFIFKPVFALSADF